MVWTLKDNMVNDLFFCATLTVHRGGHTPFVQAGAESSVIGAETVKLDPRSSWEGHSRRVYDDIGNANTVSRAVVQPLRIPSMIRPVRRTSVVVT